MEKYTGSKFRVVWSWPHRWGPQPEDQETPLRGLLESITHHRRSQWPHLESEIKEKGAEEMAELVTCLPHTHEDLSLSLSTHIRNRCGCTHQRTGETEEEISR
jgi:hypothetical protein